MEPRILRPLSDPMGNYIRPGYNDHQSMLDLLASGRNVATGLIANAVHLARQSDLMAEARALGNETILDPMTVDLSTENGWTSKGVTKLPWATGAIQVPELFAQDFEMKSFVSKIVDCVAEREFTAVFAPTHYLDSLTSPWLAVDRKLTLELRRRLDEAGLQKVLIYYPLVVKTGTIGTEEKATILSESLRGLPVDAYWLRVHPFGTNSGALVLKKYMTFCRKMHSLGVPLVGEGTGAVGVALLAFGAVGGISSGVTFGEQVNLTRYLHVPKKKSNPFSPQERVYLHEIGAFLKKDQAAAFFAMRGMKSAHGCQQAKCCPRGWRDMSADAKRHFLTRRAAEVSEVSSAPAGLRPGRYLERFLRPATDKVIKAAEVETSLLKMRRILEARRELLGRDLETSTGQFSMSPPAAGKKIPRSA
jgi:hypothetical protein